LGAAKLSLVEYEREVVVRTAGALPVVVALCEQLGLVEAVDRFCPIREIADYTHGEVVLAMVANRLSHPRPLSSFTDWGERYAVEETLGIAPVKLNDDRLGRTLDVLAEHVDEVLNLVGRRAVERFGISLAELHWDLTDLRFTGAYAEQDDGFPQVKKGRTPERTIVRQVKAGHWLASDGALPLTGRSFDGNQGDPNAVEPALAQLDALRAGLAAQLPAPLVVGDSKLCSQANVLAFQRRGLRFCCPHPKDAPLTRRLAALPEDGFQPLAYRPQRQKSDEPRYLAQPGELTIAGHTLRALFVLSLDDREAARAQRERQWTRLQEEIRSLNGGVPRYTKTASELERKAQQKIERRGLAGLVRLTIDEHPGKPQARLARDEAAIAEATLADGRYCLLSNDRDLTADELFAAYKRQHLIENRFRDWKGPLAVRPIFLQNNRRITALVTIISIALLLYGLIERQVRRGLHALDERERRLLAQRIGRATTARKILDQLSDLISTRSRDGPAKIAQPRPIQHLLLRLLELE
jgi:transposase